MSTSPTSVVQQIGILVLDDNAPGGSAVKQILDSEGWRVRLVSDTKMLLAELKTGEWSLVIANVALMGVEGPAFVTIRELATVPAADGGRVRALYIIPELASGQYIPHLEAARLPYVRKKKKLAAQSNSMFASRDSFSYTDEELAEYEKQEGELSKSKRNRPRINLGDPNR